MTKKDWPEGKNLKFLLLGVYLLFRAGWMIALFIIYIRSLLT